MAAKPVPGEEVLTTEEAAAFLREKPATLKKRRREGTGPAYIKLGGARQSDVRYLRSDLIAWLHACRRVPAA